VLIEAATIAHANAEDARWMDEYAEVPRNLVLLPLANQILSKHAEGISYAIV
jgi:hypothetical protein